MSRQVHTTQTVENTRTHTHRQRRRLSRGSGPWGCRRCTIQLLAQKLIARLGLPLPLLLLHQLWAHVGGGRWADKKVSCSHIRMPAEAFTWPGLGHDHSGIRKVIKTLHSPRVTFTSDGLPHRWNYNRFIVLKTKLISTIAQRL